MIQQYMIQDHMQKHFIDQKQKIIVQSKEIQEPEMLGQDITDGHTDL